MSSFSPKLLRWQLDGRVLAALYALPEASPYEALAYQAGVSFDELRASMGRLGRREPWELDFERRVLVEREEFASG